MSKFIEIEVSRPIFSTLIVEVADDFDWQKDRQKLNLDDIAQKTTGNKYSSDWTDDGIYDVEWHGTKEIPAKEAKDYDYFDSINNKVIKWKKKIKCKNCEKECIPTVGTNICDECSKIEYP